MLGMGWFGSSPGGLDRYYRELLEHLPEAAGVVIGPAQGAPGRVTAVSGHRAPLPRRLAAFWWAARRAGAAAEIVDAHFALYALAPLTVGPLRRLPTVVHFQGPWAEENVAAGDASKARLALRRALERRVLAHADAVVVLSSAFRRLLVERYGVQPWDVRVWAPGVALERFTPGERSPARARLQIPEPAFVAVCARRLVPRMGIGGLLDAWAKIEGELPEGSQLLIIGEGELGEEIAARAARPPLSGRVRVLGRVSDEELIDGYRAADVAVVPSVSFEGYGLVVLEAAACGTPSIVSDVGGLPEAAGGLDPSLVVPPQDTRALAERIGGAARGALPAREQTRRYAEGFTWTALAERHRRLYRGLAGGERDERLRVVYLDHVARLSGGEIALLRLLPHCERTNAHVILAEDGPLASRLVQAGISVEVLPIAPAAREMRKDSVRPGGASPAVALHTLAYVARLARRLRSLQPDLVHANSLKSGVYGGLAARAAGVPLLWHVRDRIAEDYLPRPAVRLTRAMIGRLADGVIANSQATLETLSPPRRDRLRAVIPDSVERSPLPPAPAGGATTFGMLGRIAPWKGQDLFLRAFAAAFRDGEERAVIVGTPMFGEEPYEQEIRRLAGDLGLAERVEFRGFREDIWAELASFDVLVHASVIPEPFGQVVLEGMAASLAVIAPDEGGPATLIEHGRTGLLFRSRSRESLTFAMRALCEDPAERERLGAAALQAVGEYDPRVLSERLQDLYASLVTAGPRAGR